MLAEEKKKNEDLQQKDIKPNFDKGLELIAFMLYDIIDYSVASKALPLWHQVAKKPEDLLNALQDFYKNFFANPDLNEALVVSIMNKALN